MKPSETGIVRLWDLPEKKIRLRLDRCFSDVLLNIAKNEAGGVWNNLARLTGIPIPRDKGSTSIRQMRRTGVIRLDVLRKLASFLVDRGYTEYSLSNIERKIDLIKTKRGDKSGIRFPKFPIDFNTREGARIISRLFHDGGIVRHNLEPFYCNIDNRLRARFVTDVNKMFPGISPISVNHNGKEVIYPKILGLILVSIGLVPGRRPVNNPKFPKFVFDYPKELIFEFLSQAIADDGRVCVPKKGFGYVYFGFTVDLTRFSETFRLKIIDDKIKEYLPNVLLGNIELFEKVDCKVEGPYINKEYSYVDERGVEKEYTQEWRIYVRDFRSLNILRKNLRIPLKYKQDRLEKISRKKRQCTILRFDILNVIKKVGRARRFEIVENTGYKIGRVDYNLRAFRKLGFVGKEYFGHNNAFTRYFLTEKGIIEASIYE